MDNGFLRSYINIPSRYVMPSFPDEPPLRPDEPAYQMIAQRFTPEEWNKHTDDFKWSVIASMNQTQASSERDQYRTRAPLAERAPGLVATNETVAARKQRLAGLFGSKPGESSTISLPFKAPERRRG